MTAHQAAPLPSPAPALSSRGLALQKKCACGGDGAGRCAACHSERHSRTGGRIGHDFSRLRVHHDAERRSAQVFGAPPARRRLLGEAAYDPELGIVKRSVFKEHCAGDCVAKHEDAHVEDLSLCCERYGRCYHNGADVAGRNTCREAWIDWWKHIDAWTECNAYTAEHACLRKLLEDRCPPGSSHADEACCQELQREFLGVERRICKYCPNSLLWPCPFGDDGSIRKI